MVSELSIARAKANKARRVKQGGNEYLVVPMVALKTGVYQCANCDSPELYDAEVFARIPASWNDRPVTLGHPQREGLFVSAGSADVWAKEGLGRIRNARRDGDKLVMEAWIDVLKADEVGDEGAAVVDALEDEEQIDVSVGAFIETQNRPGIHGGKKFAKRQLSYVPDHVALLPGQTGACSWEDGCGAPRVNQATEDRTMTLDDKELILPLKDGGVSLPLTATSKIALEANHQKVGASSCECSTETCSCDDPKASEENSDNDSPLAGLLEFKNQAIGDTAKRRILQAALTQKFGTDFYYSVVEVFDQTVVYEHRGGVYSRDYSINEDGSVTLSDKPIKGALVAEFMPITVQKENETMTDRKTAIDGLIANAASPWTEDQRAFLTDMSDEHFSTLAGKDDQDKPKADSGEADASLLAQASPAAVTEPRAEDVKAAADAAPKTLEAYLAEAPAALREVMQEGINARSRVRAGLFETIKSCSHNPYSDDELNAMTNDQLGKVAAMAATVSPGKTGAVADYSGQVAASSFINQESGFVPAPKMHDYTQQ